MEVSRQMHDDSRRVPIKAGIKPGLQVKGRSTRQPLAGVGNVVRNVTNNPALKEKQFIKPVKDIKKADIKKSVDTVPKVEKCDKFLDKVKEAFSGHSLPVNVKDIDIDDENNPQLVSRFVKDIYRYMRILEEKYPIRKNFMEGQPEVSGKMRAVLVDWLVQVHSKFHLLPETLYLTIAIIDRFLQIEKVRRSKLQLLGVTAMFIASKYEEMYAPEVGDFVYITDNTYSKNEILKMEQVVLKKLNFSLGKPLPLHFLRRNSKAGEVDASLHTLAKYLMELVLIEYEMAHFQPSLVAASALYLSLKLLEDNEEDPWTDSLAYYSGYSKTDLLPIVLLLCKVLQKVQTSKLQAVYMKYSNTKFMKIATFPQLSASYIKDTAEQLKQ